MLVSWHLRGRKLRGVVLPQRGEHAGLQRVVVRDDVPHIWRDRRVSDHARSGKTSRLGRARSRVFTVQHVIDLSWGRLKKKFGGGLDAFRRVHLGFDQSTGCG